MGYTLITKATDDCNEVRKATWNMKVVTYLKANRSDDSLIRECEPDSAGGTFSALRKALENAENVYGVIGYNDSLVREYAFEGLANLMKVPYDTVYRMWIEGFTGRVWKQA